MKITKILLLAFFIVSTICLRGNEVNFFKAEKVAINFYYHQYNNLKDKINFSEIEILEYFEEFYNNKRVLFIFNFKQGGFVIIPANDAMEPVLGYSLTGAFDPKIKNSNPNKWLNTYKRQIDYLINNKISQAKDIKAKWDKMVKPPTIQLTDNQKDIDPLIIMQWGQTIPYNYFCPETSSGGSGQHVYAGPFAVAMSQIMQYWRYPIQGLGSHSYTNPLYDTLSADFGETTYRWDGMEIDLTVTKNLEPTSTLIYHTGISVNTNYGPAGSPANPEDIPFAFTNYFKYHESCESLIKNQYPIDEWEQMIIDDLDNYRPVLYSGGEDTNYDHAFVIDGYQQSDDNFFHFNFGWEGYMDGWYLLSDAGGLTVNQRMTHNIFPAGQYAYGCEDLKVITEFAGTIEDGSGYPNNYENNVECYWLIDPQTETDSVTYLVLKFLRLATEPSNDIVTIYDGETTNSPVLGSYSGNSIPSQIESSGNKVLIRFNTNNSITGRGWILKFISGFPNYCSGPDFNELSGTFNDGSGDFYYNNMSGCYYTIEPPVADNIAIYFNYFDTEPGKDELKIYDSNTTQLLILSGFYSPGNVPDPFLCESYGAFISFSSDVYLNGYGWEIYYDTSSVLVFPPKNVQIENDIYSVSISWEPPTVGSLTLEGYNLYRNGELINSATITDTVYTEIVEYGTYNYCVTAVYPEKESQYVCNHLIVPCYGTLELQLSDALTGLILENAPFYLGSTMYTTGENGMYSDLLPEDEYQLVVDIPGYDYFDSTIAVPCDLIMNVNVFINPIIPSPDSLLAEVVNDSLIICSWEAIDTSGFIYSLMGYNIYRNDTLLNSSAQQDTTFSDIVLFNSQFQYCVTSVYDLAESEKTCDSAINSLTGQLEGYVRNSITSDPIENAVLSIESYADTTNQNGYFLLQDIPIGLYNIHISADNFELVELNQVEINYGVITNIQVELIPLYLNTPEDLQFSFNSNILELSWTESQISPWILLGYNIYYKTQNSGEYEQLNAEIIEETFYIDSEYIFPEKTFYYVTAIYNAGESDSSNIILVDFESVNENKFDYIKIYPNPGNGIFNVYFKSPILNGDISIEVHSLKGTKLFNKELKNAPNPLIINLSEFEKGIYLLFIKGDGINTSEKIVIF